MSKSREFLKRHIILIGLMAVVVPLLSILALQYWSLKQLEKTSVVAGTVGMKNYLNDVSKEVKSFYKTTGEEVLNVPAYAIEGGDLKRAKYHFQNCNVEGVKSLFVASFGADGEMEMLFFSPAGEKLAPDAPAAELHAAQRATAPMRLLSKEGTPVKTPVGYFEDRDPENRVMYKPILDDESKVVGAAGMILDTGYFREVLVPRLVRETLPRFFPNGADQNVIVSFADQKGRVLFASQKVGGQDDKTSAGLPYFYDHNLVIRSRHMTPEQWANWNFNFTLTLSLLMTAVLIGGIAFSLRTASREMRLSQMKADFVSNVSHELRTPLASIRVFGEFMKLGRVKDEAKIQEYGEHIETESRRLTQLVNNILDFSKIESGHKTYKFERASIEEIVAETLKTCEVRLKQKGFGVVFNPAPRPLPLVMADRDALAQALMNLLDNAVKFSEEAVEKEVIVSLSERDGFVDVSVTDHGIGIAPEEVGKIFEKFYRVSTGLVHDVKGSGLGLSLVKHIMDAHHGKIGVMSAPGRGSTFTLSLPVVEGRSAEKRRRKPVVGGDAPQDFAFKH